MKLRLLTGSALLVVAVPVWAQGGRTAQEAYNSGQAAFDAGNWAAADSAYAEALQRMTPQSASVPIVHARRATALWNLRRIEPAVTEAQAAVARFNALHVSTNEDLASAYDVLGNVARLDLDEPAAADAFGRELETADGPNKAHLAMNARLGLAMATITSDPARATQALDAVLASPEFETLAKPRQADVLALRARAALNRGDAREALRFIDRALGPGGGTTSRVSVAQTRIRGDAALIHAKLGDPDKVRLYLAYSGAGHLPDNGWLNRGEDELPVCGADVRPDDVAVVEFAIDDNGRTLGAAPVYASRPGSVGATFARAVRGWRWAPEYIKKLDAFWRSSVRVELRCVTRPPGIDLADNFRDEVQASAAAGGVTVDVSDPTLKAADLMDDPKPAARALQVMLEATQASHEPNWDRVSTDLGRMLDAAGAPAAVRAYLLRRLALVEEHTGKRQQARARVDALITALEHRPDGLRAATWLRAERAFALEDDGDWTNARQLLATITALPPAALPTDDPVRTVAVLHEAMIDRHLGHGAAADSRLAAAGIDAEQCSILNVRPVATNQSVSSSTFPRRLGAGLSRARCERRLTSTPMAVSRAYGPSLPIRLSCLVPRPKGLWLGSGISFRRWATGRWDAQQRR